MEGLLVVGVLRIRIGPSVVLELNPVLYLFLLFNPVEVVVNFPYLLINNPQYFLSLLHHERLILIFFLQVLLMKMTV